MNLRSDKGFTVAELLVTVSLLFLLLGSVYYTLEAIEVSARVSDRQATYAREISTPLHAMDKVLCQNKAILPTSVTERGTEVSDGYTLITRSPVQYGTGTYTRYVYTVEYSDGKWKLVERTYRHSVTSTTYTPLRTKVWSEYKADEEQGPPTPVFTYRGSNDTTITDPADVATARSVVVELYALHEGRPISGRRHIYFRNR